MTAPLRVLYLLPADGFGGAERQGVEHLAELRRHAVLVESVVGASPALLGALASAGTAGHVLPDFPPAASPSRSALDVVRAVRGCFSAANAVEERVRTFRPDVVFANRTFAWLIAALASRRTGVPYVIRAGSRPAHPVLGPLLSLLDRTAPPAAVFYNCDAVRDSIASRFRCPSFDLPNVVDVGRFAARPPAWRRASRAALGLSPDAPVVGLAARPAPEKGLEFFADVVERVVRHAPEARFLVAGEFRLRSAYEAKLAARGLGGAVRFLGHVADMPGFFETVDVVVLTSRARSIEASPNALLEAMASSRPVVATAVGGVPELVRHGVDGFLTADGDANGFAACVLELLASPLLRGALGDQGRARAVAAHRPGVIVEQLLQNLREVISPRKELVTASSGVSCESNIHSAPPSISSSARPPSRARWSSPGAAT